MGGSIHKMDVSRDRYYIYGESVLSKGAHVIYGCYPVKGITREVSEGLQ